MGGGGSEGPNCTTSVTGWVREGADNCPSTGCTSSLTKHWALWYVWGGFLSGDSKYRIPPLNPLKITKVVSGDSTLVLTLTDAEVYNLLGAKVNGIRWETSPSRCLIQYHKIRPHNYPQLFLIIIHSLYSPHVSVRKMPSSGGIMLH
jgi:hypothetical protein